MTQRRKERSRVMPGLFLLPAGTLCLHTGLMLTNVSFQNGSSLLLTRTAPRCENGRHRTGARKGAVCPNAHELTGESAHLIRSPSDGDTDVEQWGRPHAAVGVRTGGPLTPLSNAEGARTLPSSHPAPCRHVPGGGCPRSALRGTCNGLTQPHPGSNPGGRQQEDASSLVEWPSNDNKHCAAECNTRGPLHKLNIGSKKQHTAVQTQGDCAHLRWHRARPRPSWERPRGGPGSVRVPGLRPALLGSCALAPETRAAKY